MNIDKMEAGPEMDVLVAELMGWESQYVEHGGTAGEYVWVLPDGDYQSEPDVPEFSTDISAAWPVVEKMRELKPECYVLIEDFDLKSKGRVWNCAIWDGEGQSYAADAPTAPLAICRAALKVISREESSGTVDNG